MINRILATFDGSPLSEAVLPYLALLTRLLRPQEVVFFSVVEGMNEQGQALHVRDGYLKDLARGVEAPEPTEIRSVAVPGLVGQAPSMILRFAEEENMDMLLMSTHGRSGIDRWLLGSVSDKVLRAADVPVFLVRSNVTSAPAPGEIRRVLVPLDGSELAERALIYAQPLAKAAAAPLVILHVTSPERAVSGRHAAIDNVETYLENIASGLERDGIKAVIEVRPGRPADGIIVEASQADMDLIVMSSRGRTGLTRWAMGSVAEEVVRSAPVPVLIVPAAVQTSVPEHLQGPTVQRCHNCGRISYREALVAADRCGLCHYFLKSCGNCVLHNGVSCILQLSHATETYPGNRCPQFRFRKTRLALR